MKLLLADPAVFSQLQAISQHVRLYIQKKNSHIHSHIPVQHQICGMVSLEAHLLSFSFQYPFLCINPSHQVSRLPFTYREGFLPCSMIKICKYNNVQIYKFLTVCILGGSHQLSLYSVLSYVIPLPEEVNCFTYFSWMDAKRRTYQAQRACCERPT